MANLINLGFVCLSCSFDGLWLAFTFDFHHTSHLHILLLESPRPFVRWWCFFLPHLVRTQTHLILQLWWASISFHIWLPPQIWSAFIYKFILNYLFIFLKLFLYLLNLFRSLFILYWFNYMFSYLFIHLIFSHLSIHLVIYF